MTIQVISPKASKTAAKALARFLKDQGIALPHGQALDAVARMAGFENWNALAARWSLQAIDAMLLPAERAHMHDAMFADLRAEETGKRGYGPECMLVAHTGFQLRWSAEGEECDYVRVCDPLGREVCYWTCDEWAEDPALVMGAILGALVRGQPLDAKLGTVRGKCLALPAENARKPRFSDVPLDRVDRVDFNGEDWYIRFVHEEIIALLDAPLPDDEQERNALQGMAAIELSFHGGSDSSDVWVLTLGELQALVWDERQECFVDPTEGWTLRPFVVTPFRP